MIFDRLLDGSLMPHGHCLLWRSDLLFLHFGGDLLTSLAYLIIPCCLVYLVMRREDLEFNRLFIMFASFILLCGVTHIIALVNIWHGYYFIAGIFKTLTGLVSITTAVVIWRYLPKALSLPNRFELLAANDALSDTMALLEKNNQELEQRVKERTEKLQLLATTDELTGISNHRYLMTFLENEMGRHGRDGLPFTLIMLDLDHFKEVNDRFGHLVGDEVLRNVAEVLRSESRIIDAVGRYGGEEFILILPNTKQNLAEVLAERIRAAIEKQGIVLKSGEEIFYTASFGVAEYQPKQSAEDILKGVDSALYRAKHSGRNQVATNLSVQ